MDAKETAKHLKLDEKTVSRWARKSCIPAHPLGEGTSSSDHQVCFILRFSRLTGHLSILISCHNLESFETEQVTI
jgi:hypothetical protein